MKCWVHGVLSDDGGMGLFDGVLSLFGSGPEKDPLQAWQEASEDKPTQAKRAKIFLERLVASAAVDDAVIQLHFDESIAELAGRVQGMPLLLRVELDGRVEELTLGYAGDLAPLDVHYNGDEVNVPSKNDDEDERRYFHGLGVFVEGAREEGEFVALPAPLQLEVAELVRTHRVSYFRSREEGMDIDFHGGVNEAGGIERVKAILALAANVAKARIILHHRKSKAEQSAHVQHSIYDGISEIAFGRNGGAVIKVSDLAKRIAAGIPDSRVVDRPEEDRVEIRFRSEGLPARVAIEMREDTIPVVTAGVRLEGVLSAFALRFDPNAEPESADDGGGWAESERKVFFAKSTFVSSENTTAEAAFLQALPERSLQELLAIAEDVEETITLDEQVLSVDVGLMADEAGKLAIPIAHRLARAGAAFPKGTFSPASGASPAVPMRCAYCKAQFFFSETQPTCKQCGARV